MNREVGSTIDLRSAITGRNTSPLSGARGPDPRLDPPPPSKPADLRAPTKWAGAGFSVGFFWLALVGALATTRGPVLSIVFGYVAVVTCPPLVFGHDYVHAPFWNAALYCVLAYLCGRVRNWLRSN